MLRMRIGEEWDLSPALRLAPRRAQETPIDSSLEVATADALPPPPSSSDGRCLQTLVVTGNPNVGKSVLFHLLTGRYVTVSNYPGTTVMSAFGRAWLGGRAMRVEDTPGLNTLAAGSEDERVARDRLLEGDAIVLQVADAKNLARALVLTLELAEAGVALVLDLNMIDEARQWRVAIDVDGLSSALGIPVVTTIATQRWGIKRLKRILPQARRSTVKVVYPQPIEQALESMEAALPPELPAARALALLWLGADQPLIERLTRRLPPSTGPLLVQLAQRAQAACAQPLALLIQQTRRRQAQRLCRRYVQAASLERRLWIDRLSALTIHPFWGVPILIAVLALIYILVGDVAAQKGVGFLEEMVFGRYLTPALQGIVEKGVSWPWLSALLVGEYGLFTMALPYAFAIILPIVVMFFFCFGFLEDVGYLPRLAIMANRFCRLLGLNGKAVLPLLLGLGCGTMATMTTRILDSKRDRLLTTFLLALGIPCSAQLGVILAMLAGYRPLALGVWLGVILLVVVGAGRLAARLLPGEESPFIYEIPPLRRPQLSNLFIKMLGRVEWYVKEAVPLFFLGTLVLFLLDAASLLGRIEALGEPIVVSWLGLPPRATEAFLIGFLRRDFGAAGLFALQRSGAMSGTQVLVSLVTITLFVPCIAQYFMMVKEQGWRRALAIAGVSFSMALLIGGLLARALSVGGVSL